MGKLNVCRGARASRGPVKIRLKENLQAVQNVSNTLVHQHDTDAARLV